MVSLYLAQVALKEYLGYLKLVFIASLEGVLYAQSNLVYLPIVKPLAEDILGKGAVVAQYGEHQVIFEHTTSALHCIKCRLRNYRL